MTEHLNLNNHLFLLRVMQIWPHKHIHTLANFSVQDYESVFELANRFDALNNAGTKKIPALQGTLVTSLFKHSY